MFLAQPLRYAAPFAGTVFGVSLAVTLYTFLPTHDHILFIAVVALLVATVSALLMGFAFWLGLGFSQREPQARKSALSAALAYFVAYNILALFGKSTAVQWPSFGVLIAPLLYGTRWPAAWANNSLKRTAANRHGVD
jgi:hypothetical protein